LDSVVKPRNRIRAIDPFMITSKKPRHEHVISINSRVVRNINRAVILNFIRERQPISRAEIARLSKLNKSTVSSIVASLHQEEMIVEEPAQNSRVGRNPINIRLRTGKHLVGAISFDSALTRAAIVDIDGTIRHTTDITTRETTPRAFVARCVNDLNALRKHHRLDQFKGIGITVAGIVDPNQARVVFAPNLGWKDVDLLAMIRELCPDVDNVAVENDAKASALAELWFGHHDINLSNFVFLSVGRGIGSGIVIDNKVLNGVSHFAGEFGHMTLIDGGEPCSCGNLGCWEAYASDRATVQRFVKSKGMYGAHAENVTLEDVIAAATGGDSTAKEELLRTGRYLGQGIANIIKSVDPDAIVIGGPITCAWNLVAPQIMEGVKSRGFFGQFGDTNILPTSLAGQPALLGAATLSIRRFFTDVRVTL
jgi:predicted NBD/HSP70 family sugar kinase